MSQTEVLLRAFGLLVCALVVGVALARARRKNQAQARVLAATAPVLKVALLRRWMATRTGALAGAVMMTGLVFALVSVKGFRNRERVALVVPLFALSGAAMGGVLAQVRRKAGALELDRDAGRLVMGGQTLLLARPFTLTESVLRPTPAYPNGRVAVWVEQEDRQLGFWYPLDFGERSAVPALPIPRVDLGTNHLGRVVHEALRKAARPS